jgi:hypothetical protein
VQGFLYFLPSITLADINRRHVLTDYGLDVLDLEQFPRDAAVTEATAFGGPGLLVVPHCNGAPSDCVRLDESSQCWVRFGNKHIGVVRDDLPTPPLLARRQVYPGWAVPDAAGREWMVPVARSHKRQPTIPSDYIFDDAGQPQPRIKPSFEWLWQLSARLYDHYMTDTLTIDLPELVTHTASILSINYRLGLGEINCLTAAGAAVIDGNFAQLVTAFVIDMPMMDEYQKKSESLDTVPVESGSS